MPLKPEVTVAALAEQDGRFLLIEERIKGRAVFNQPAGHVEIGETLLEAVAREAREETAWRFTPRALVGIYLWRHPGGARSILRFAFAGGVDDHHAAQPLDRGILCTHWLTRAEVVDRQPRLRSPLVLRCIDDYLAGRRHPLDLVAYFDLHSASDAEAVNV
jgi:ADP-ribose pyrophosphatase YjhB (NUDIX family)